MRSLAVWVVIGASALAYSCSSASGPPGDIEPAAAIGQRVGKLSNAYCSISVRGKGSKDTETDYLPRVIACENGGASLEALKAQAIAARSVAYYNMATEGSICDSQSCQVYTCSKQPEAIHYQAVAETARQYLGSSAMLTYGFYVAGDPNVDGPSCVDSGGATTKWVTYNDGKRGSDVTQTKLGFVGPPGFGQNRGCMSQWGARCLENDGRDYAGILRFYYGADIEIITAPGDCGTPNASPSTAVDAGDGSPDASPASDGSCTGQCYESSAAPGSMPACYCDLTCEDYGDCCSDYEAVCGVTPSTPTSPTPSGACTGLCGSSQAVTTESGSCYCDASCEGYGDCCSDYTSSCGDEPTNPVQAPDQKGATEGSCVGLCGMAEPVANGSSACYCEESCWSYGDCCADYAAACP